MEHHHEHHGHCHCSNAHSEAEQLVEKALVISKTWIGTEGLPTQLTEKLRCGLSALAELLGEDGIILGHLKGLLQCGTCYLACSVTRTDQLDFTSSADWPPTGPGDWKLTITVLSLCHQDQVTEKMLDELFG